MVIFKLGVMALGNALLAIVLYILEKKTDFGKLNFWVRQIFIGILFGALACFSGENGVPVRDTVAHVRDAGPLCAGLIFGAPSGIIAGFIAGIYRWFSVYWGAGTYTRIACTVATILAGFIAAAMRKFLFEDKKPTFFYGVGIAAITEIIHMLLIFITNMNEIKVAFEFVMGATVPIVTATTFAVGLAVLVVNIIGREKNRDKSRQKQITQTFQTSLLVCIFVAYGLASCFTYILQNNMSNTQTNAVININLNDIKQDIKDTTDSHLLSTVQLVKKEYLANENKDSAFLGELAKKYGVHEINVIGKKFTIEKSNVPEYIGYEMGSRDQSKEFEVLLSGNTKEYVQDYRPTGYDDGTKRKYAACTLDDGSFIQVGYNGEQFRKDIDGQIVTIAKNRHIGENGFVTVCDEEGNIVSSHSENKGKNLEQFGLSENLENAKQGKTYKIDFDGVPHYAAYQEVEGYYLIGMITVYEADLIKNVTIYVSIFILTIIFAALFILIYVLIKVVIIDNIRKINKSLAQITGGNLDVKVDVRANREFASLSDDINSTVDTLKEYIAEAAARIDKELEFAKQIQFSALPSVFPPFPDRHDFEIYACMDAAKEVGGDFYDFYMLNSKTLAFLIADVSGKGIGAAMFMMRAKTIIKDLAESGLEIDEIFTKANSKLCESNDAGMFVTAWMGILDLSEGKLKFVNAGHNPPLLKRADGSFEYLKARSGLVLAGMDTVKYRKNETEFNPGDKIYLYTDGITEATNINNELYGEERLLEFINGVKEEKVQQLCTLVKKDVEEFVDTAPQFDDMTMVCVELKCVKNDDRAELVPDKDSVKEAALFGDRLAKRLETVPKVANKVNIVIDEIYSNIVNYSNASRAFITAQITGEKLVLVFSDNGSMYNPLEAESPDVTLSAQQREIGGLGIFMVKKFSESMDYEYKDGFNVLTVVLKLS